MAGPITVIGFALLTFGATAGLTRLFVRPVTGASMEPTLKQGSFVVVLPRWSTAAVALDDVVLLKDAWQPDTLLVKRVVGQPGDCITPAGLPRASGSRQPCVTLGAHRYYVVGDNPRLSTDSRRFGPVSEEAVIGRVLFALWPPQLLGKLGDNAAR